MTTALLLEFDFDAVTRPRDIGTSSDPRSLAVRFQTISLTDDATGKPVATFDLAGPFPPGFYSLFGVSHPEPKGAWSDGRCCCFIMFLREHPLYPFSVTILHEIFSAQSCVGASVRVNGRSIGDISFGGGQTTFAVPANVTLPAIAAAATKNMSLHPTAEVALSILILNYNRWELTVACLIWLLGSEVKVPYQIIVVDNGSDPAQVSALQCVDLPIEIVRLAERRSFGEANNIAVEAARGSNLLLLNNDVFLRSQCIERLLAALADEAIGAVGPVFEDSEGRLQEAGASISLDGTAHLRNYSYFQAGIHLPALSAVDHISAACLMVRRDEFIELGGFDLAYDPAYYEDVDLCCQIRASGKDVILVRDARAMHIRNATVNTLAGSDRILAAPARNRAVFLARWSAWLTTKDAQYIPIRERVSIDGWDKAREPLLQQSVNAVLFTAPLRRRFDACGAIAIASAISRVRPTLFCSHTPYSMLSLLNLANEFSIPTERVRTASEASLGRREVDTLILSTCEMPPEAHRYGEHRILHCPMPVLPRGLTERERRERLDALSSYEFVVTDSELAQRKVLAALRYIGGPALPVEFILPPIPETEGTPGREDIVVSAGRFRNGLAGGSHDLVLRGFQEFRASSANRNWQLICVGEIESQDDLAYFQDFSFRAAAWQVRCILMPTRHQRMELYRRAKVCVSANASGVLADDEDWANLYAVIDIRDAIGHGCVPVVYARGAEAELCEHVGFRFVFDRADEVAQQIALAAAYAQSDSFLRASPLRGGVWSRSTFYKGWDRLLASKIENVRSEPAVNF